MHDFAGFAERIVGWTDLLRFNICLTSIHFVKPSTSRSWGPSSDAFGGENKELPDRHSGSGWKKRSQVAFPWGWKNMLKCQQRLGSFLTSIKVSFLQKNVAVVGRSTGPVAWKFIESVKCPAMVDYQRLTIPKKRSQSMKIIYDPTIYYVISHSHFLGSVC